MKIWVDADAIPGEIADLIFRATQRLQIPAIFVANKYLRLPVSPFISFIQVEKGDDVADGLIASKAMEFDIAITADIPLASLLVPNKVTVINPRGDLYTHSNIQERLSIRDFMSDLRGSGVITGGPRPFDNRAKAKFAATFDTALTKNLRDKKLRLAVPKIPAPSAES